MRRALPILLLVFAVACGSNSPTTPSPTPTPQPTPPPSAQGVWTGTWVRQNCTEGPSAAGACEVLPLSGPFSAVLTQTGTAIQGSLELGSFVLTANGPIGADGVLRLGGTGRAANVTINLVGWESSNTTTAMTGSFRFVVIPDNPAFGTTNIGATLSGVTKTS